MNCWTQQWRMPREYQIISIIGGLPFFPLKKWQVMRGHKIVADGWAGANSAGVNLLQHIEEQLQPRLAQPFSLVLQLQPTQHNRQLHLQLQQQAASNSSYQRFSGVHHEPNRLHDRPNSCRTSRSKQTNRYPSSKHSQHRRQGHFHLHPTAGGDDDRWTSTTATASSKSTPRRLWQLQHILLQQQQPSFRLQPSPFCSSTASSFLNWRHYYIISSISYNSYVKFDNAPTPNLRSDLHENWCGTTSVILSIKSTHNINLNSRRQPEGGKFPILVFGHIELFLDVVYKNSFRVVSCSFVCCFIPQKLENHNSDVDEIWSVLFSGHY